jgi:hypothetical protein
MVSEHKIARMAARHIGGIPHFADRGSLFWHPYLRGAAFPIKSPDAA